MIQEGSLMAKGKWNQNLHLIFFRQGGQIYEFTHIMTIKLFI